MDPHRDLESRAFAGNWRVYQQQALDAFDADVAAGDNRAYLVLPPGAGKTMIGLEAARRLGRRSLVLVPNTAVQAQWAAAWDNSFPSSDRSASKCGTERGLASAMNVLTYQSLPSSTPKPIRQSGGKSCATATSKRCWISCTPTGGR